MSKASIDPSSLHLPSFITAPGETDVLFVVVVIFILILILVAGVLYFTLHSLPENMAHKASSAQLQVIGLLSLLALFTHNNMFWVAALLLAAIKVPDYLSPLQSIARSLKNLAKLERTVQPARRPDVPKPGTPGPVVVPGKSAKVGIKHQEKPAEIQSIPAKGE